jgi:hypothetical protein
MVNYNDPVTIAREFRACPDLPRFKISQPSLPIFLFNSGTCETLACYERYIHVSLTALPRCSADL